MKNSILSTLINAVIARAGDKTPVIIAIDGPSATGKTTFAKQIASEFDCNVFHMDDFFLTEEEKTEERLAVAGGNIAWERFRDTVLEQVIKNEPFTYQKYNCNNGGFYPSKEVQPKQLVVVEGVYSHHPELIKYYDYKIFFDVTKKTQSDRIKKRNSKKMYERFMNEWIPLEDKYFEECGCRPGANFVFDSSKAF